MRIGIWSQTVLCEINCRKSTAWYRPLLSRSRVTALHPCLLCCVLSELFFIVIHSRLLRSSRSFVGLCVLLIVTSHHHCCCLSSLSLVSSILVVVVIIVVAFSCFVIIMVVLLFPVTFSSSSTSLVLVIIVLGVAVLVNVARFLLVSWSLSWSLPHSLASCLAISSCLHCWGRHVRPRHHRGVDYHGRHRHRCPGCCRPRRLFLLYCLRDIEEGTHMTTSPTVAWPRSMTNFAPFPVFNSSTDLYTSNQFPMLQPIGWSMRIRKKAHVGWMPLACAIWIMIFANSWVSSTVSWKAARLYLTSNMRESGPSAIFLLTMLAVWSGMDDTVPGCCSSSCKQRGSLNTTLIHSIFVCSIS